MKVIAIFVALLAVSLAAPSEKANHAEETVEVAEKLGETEEAVKPSDESPNKAEDTPSAEVASSEEDPPAVDTASSAEDKKTDEETVAETENPNAKYKWRPICRNSTGATQEQITAISEDPIDDAPKVVKCYVECLSRHYVEETERLMKEESYTKEDIIRRFLPSSLTPEEVEKIGEICAGIKFEDPCDDAYQRYACYNRASEGKIRIS